jgi:hypothetical protein
MKPKPTQEKQEEVEDLPVADTTDSKALVAKSDTLMDEIDAILDQNAVQKIRETAVETSAAYTLADAMREGSQVTDQAVGTWTRRKPGDVGEACALAACMTAVRARGLA